jgi:hypothetical protein
VRERCACVGSTNLCGSPGAIIRLSLHPRYVSAETDARSGCSLPVLNLDIPRKSHWADYKFELNTISDFALSA